MFAVSSSNTTNEVVSPRVPVDHKRVIDHTPVRTPAS